MLTIFVRKCIIKQYVYKATLYIIEISLLCYLPNRSEVLSIMFKNKKLSIIITICVVLVVVFSLGVFYAFQAKFHDFTLELGQQLPDVSAFTTSLAVPQWSSFETDINTLDISKPGAHKLTLRHGFQTETVTLNIVDTTAPTVIFRDLTVNLGTEISPKDMVVSCADLSEVSIDFGAAFVQPDTFSTQSVEVVVSDIYGNITRKECSIHYVWIVPEYTLEIGQKITMEDLLTCTERDDAILSKNWIEEINEAPLGTYTFESCYGEYTQTCTVTIQDTLPPELDVTDLSVYLGDTVIADDFIKSIADGSGSYEITTSQIPDTNVVGTHSITIQVTDNSGNSVSKTVQLEVIEDHKAPVFTGISPLNIELGEEPSFRSGVRAIDNHDGSVEFSVDASSVDLETIGTYRIVYSAVDGAGNRATATRTLTVNPDATPPKFSGLSDLTVEKNSSPDYVDGVTATDRRDGDVAITYNADNVDLSSAGTYYITYTAEDSSGNVATARRKVVVNIDSSDVAALVAEIASGLSSNPETIRDYVRNTVGYNTNWGGVYPVWYGFTTKTGNCYVHALCFQALLKAKGFETMLIWCENKSHYWNLVKINGEWKHMDSTPGFAAHMVYSIMNDEQRHETLNGRDWDRAAWPASN